MHKTYRKFTHAEISTLFLIGTMTVIVVGIFLSYTLNKQPKKTSSYAQSLTCPYDSNIEVQLGQTESDPNNSENRWPISSHIGDYDSLSDVSNFKRVDDDDVLKLTKTDGAAIDDNIRYLMASMFGYKPKRIISAYDPPNFGGSYIIEVPVGANNNTIKMPNTGYDIGGGYEAMVVFVAHDRITLHIGRHEYFVGTKKCANGQICSGGYWIYIKNICVDTQIQKAFNQIKDAQAAARADLTPIRLPMILPGQIIGKAISTSVLVGVRDNGPFISLYKPDYWGGVSEVEFEIANQNPTNTPIPKHEEITPVKTVEPTQVKTPIPTQEEPKSKEQPSPTQVEVLAPPTIPPTMPIPSPAPNQGSSITPTPKPNSQFVVTENIYTVSSCNDEIQEIAMRIFKTEVICPTRN